MWIVANAPSKLKQSGSQMSFPDQSHRQWSLIIAIVQVLAWFLCLVVNFAIDLPSAFLPLQILLQSFLFVGLFIVAHDCMHGVVGPEGSHVGRYLGGICTFLFAGFSFDKLKVRHDEHHEAPASSNDLDYTRGTNENFLVWLFAFITRYSGVREFLILHIHVIVLYWLSGSFLKVLLFFAIPSWIASLQLFYFGTYLPHRRFQSEDQNPLKARSNSFPVWLSFLTCYHFGYHREHHKYPYLAWWRLPMARRHDSLIETSEAL